MRCPTGFSPKGDELGDGSKPSWKVWRIGGLRAGCELGGKGGQEMDARVFGVVYKTGGRASF